MSEVPLQSCLVEVLLKDYTFTRSERGPLTVHLGMSTYHAISGRGISQLGNGLSDPVT